MLNAVFGYFLKFCSDKFLKHKAWAALFPVMRFKETDPRSEFASDYLQENSACLLKTQTNKKNQLFSFAAGICNTRLVIKSTH